MRLKLGFIMLIVGALLVSGCGDDEDAAAPEEPATTATTAETTTSTAGEPTSSTAAGAEAPPVDLEQPVNNHGTQPLEGDSLSMELDDFYFDPTFVTAAEGRRVTVRLHNEGDVAHTFTIDSLEIDEVLDPGQEREVVVDLPADGPVRFICRFHQGRGMKGAFAIG